MEYRNWMRIYPGDESQFPSIKKEIDALNDRNYRVFGLTNERILASAKDKTKIQTIQKRRKAEFDNGWYCIYTDNIEHKDKFIYDLVILTVHGNPGDEKEWLSLEDAYQNKGRFINFVVPGYDGEPIERGSFNANWSDVCKMIVLLLDKLQIPKIIYCGHSMGGLLMYNFCTTFPERVEGCIFMAAPPNAMYIGLTVFDSIVRIFAQEKLKGDLSLLADSKFRADLVKEFNEMTRDIYFQIDNERKTTFPILRDSELCTWIKMLDEKKPWEHLNKLKDMPAKLSLLMFARNDPLVHNENYYITFHDILRRSPIPAKDVGIDKQFLAEVFGKDHIEDFPENLQELFMIIFEKGGHQIHVRHGRILASVIEKYLKVMERVRKNQMELKPKL